MTIRSIETEQARAMLFLHLKDRPLPFTVEINAGRQRSIKQNKLQQLWFVELTEELGEDVEYWRCYCKLHFGVPIRRNASDKFKAAYDADIQPLPYELKMKLMGVPYDFPVTRDMTVKQMTLYIDTIHRHFAERGVRLTDPEDLKWAQDER